MIVQSLPLVIWLSILIQGPPGDQVQEEGSQMSITELKELRQTQMMQMEEKKKRKEEKEVEVKKAQEEKSEGIDWGKSNIHIICWEVEGH